MDCVQVAKTKASQFGPKSKISRGAAGGPQECHQGVKHFIVETTPDQLYVPSSLLDVVADLACFGNAIALRFIKICLQECACKMIPNRKVIQISIVVKIGYIVLLPQNFSLEKLLKSQKDSDSRKTFKGTNSRTSESTNSSCDNRSYSKLAAHK
uniref:Uncharacterized protein n=1 Tax=Romanomermis culicivorax TaxID=13658 RepID=A0A915K8E3_ROMCU